MQYVFSSGNVTYDGVDRDGARVVDQERDRCQSQSWGSGVGPGSEPEPEPEPGWDGGSGLGITANVAADDVAEGPSGQWRPFSWSSDGRAS